MPGSLKRRLLFFVNNLTPKIEKWNLESADLRNEDLITLVSHCQRITELDLVLNSLDANYTIKTGRWEGLQTSLAAIAAHLSENLTKIQLPWQIYPVSEFINQMPKLKYVWHHPDKDPRNFVKVGLKPPTMFGEPIGGKDPLRRECPRGLKENVMLHDPNRRISSAIWPLCEPPGPRRGPPGHL